MLGFQYSCDDESILAPRFASIVSHHACKITCMDLSERILKARTTAKLNKSQLARLVNVSHTAVGLWEDGSTKNLRSDNLFKIADATNCNPQWLITGHGDSWLDGNYRIKEPAANYIYRIPIVGNAQAGPDGYWDDLGQLEHGDGFVSVVSTDPNAYALRVKGDSMAPAINNGWIVVIEPNSTPHLGEYVLVCTTDGLCMIKELRYDRETEYTFGSINDKHPAMTVQKINITRLQPVTHIVSPSKRQV